MGEISKLAAIFEQKSKDEAENIRRIANSELSGLEQHIRQQVASSRRKISNDINDLSQTSQRRRTLDRLVTAIIVIVSLSVGYWLGATTGQSAPVDQMLDLQKLWGQE